MTNRKHVMKILYITTVFPRSEESSTIYSDFAEKLRDEGHEVTVVMGEGKRKLKETAWFDERGLKVLRVRIRDYYDVEIFQKGVSLITFKWSLEKAIAKNLKDASFDVVLFEAPPLTMAGPVSFAMRLFKCPSYLMLKDIFPQNALDLGLMTKRNPFYWWFKLQENKLYRTATSIGCMSPANSRYLQKHCTEIPNDKIHILPNAKKIVWNGERPVDYPMRRKYGLQEEVVIAIFGGNMGKPQGIDFLMDLIENNKDRTDLFFLMVGRGTERVKIRQRIEVKELKNVKLIDALPRDDYERLVRECDIGLICLDKRFTIPNFPSRVLTYFDYKMPVLAALDSATDFGKMLDESRGGEWALAGDIYDFQKKLNKLVLNPLLRQEMGINGREYLEEHFTVEKAYSIFMSQVRNFKRGLENV